jgi:hypothetical protein
MENGTLYVLFTVRTFHVSFSVLDIWKMVHCTYYLLYVHFTYHFQYLIYGKWYIVRIAFDEEKLIITFMKIIIISYINSPQSLFHQLMHDTYEALERCHAKTQSH